MSKISAKKTVPHPFSLRSVYLRDGKQWIADGFDPVLPGQPLYGQFRTAGTHIEVQEAVENIPNAQSIKSCRITSKFEFRYLDEPREKQDRKTIDSSDKHLIAEVSASFTVDYLINAQEIPHEEKLSQWASSNALLHCWPYWREFCQSTLLRMNLPVIMMPMMEVNPKED